MRIISRNRFGVPVFVLCCGLLLSLLGMFQQRAYNHAALAHAGQLAADDAATRIASRLAQYRYGLLGARGALAVIGFDRMDRAGFERYSATRRYEDEFPGARGFGVIRRVPTAGEKQYVERMARERWPGFAIRQLQPHAGERYVIELIEPIARNRAAIGLDVASEAGRRQAADSARDSGAATLTAPITLVQASGKSGQAFLLLLPVYGPGVAQTPASVVGWTYAPLVMDEVLGRLGKDMPDGRLELDDVTDGARPVRFHAAGAGAVAAPQAERLSSVLGRTWRLRFTPSAAFVAGEKQLSPGYVGAGGALLAVLLSVLSGTLQAQHLRKRRLYNAQARLAAIVEGSVDAIIGSWPDGIVASWNSGAERMFGFSAREAIGRPVGELIVPEALQDEEKVIQARAARGEHTRLEQTRRQRKDGSLCEVSIAVAPIRDSRGRLTGSSKTLRDISTLLAAQREVSILNASLEGDVARRTAELETARRALRTVLDAVPAMIGYWDKELVNRVANRAYGQFFGLDADAIPGRTLPALLGPELYARVAPRVAAALRGEVQHFEGALCGADGVTRDTLAHYVPDVIDGQLAGFYVIVHDVSDLVANRQALATALRQNDVLVRTINDQLLYSVTDTAGRILEVNDNFCTASGYSRAELLGANHRLMRSGEHDAAFWAGMWQTIAAGDTWHGTICNRGADGSLRWFDTVIAPYFNEQRGVERYVALRTDVTDRHVADAALQRLSALLGNVLRAASETAIIATDPDGVITVFNSGAERMLGYAADELIGCTSPALLHDVAEVEDRSAALSAQIGRPVAGFRVFVELPLAEGMETREWTYVRKDGARVPVSLTVTAMRDEQGAVLGYLGMATDISRRKRDEAALRDSMRLAQQASQAKSDFVANMSHEIRTPMNAVLGMLALAQRTELSERQRDYLDKAGSAGRSLMSLLNDILDFSKIEAGKLELDSNEFEVEALLGELASVLAGTNAHKTVEVLFDVDPATPAWLTGDRQRLLQVLINLAGNAIKFTPEGHVVVVLKVLARAPGQVSLRLSVRDSGIGIAADQRERIFDGFTQAEASTARRFGGTGLGLAISANLVRLMGGSLALDSEPGKGSCFWFDLNLAAGERQDAGRHFDGMRVLVVDDSRLAGAIMADLAARLGCAPLYVPSGGAALDALAAARGAGTPFDAVLMDLRMPGMSGAQCARLMAGDPAGAPPVLIVTAFAQDELDEHSARAPAYSALLTKPVTPGSLAAALERALLPVPATAALAPGPAPARLAGMRLLVVEDNALNRQVACELLAAEGATVALAEGGIRGVALATAPDAAFDTVIMDVQMPDIDGLEATRRIRRVVPAQRLPIVAMTANASLADGAACLAAGMDAHIGKPFDIDQVVAVLSRWRSVPATVAAPAPAPPIAAEIDFEGALRRFMDKPDTYRRALGEFERDAAAMLAELAGHLERGDAHGVAALLHAFKGVALTIGAPGLAARLRQEDSTSGELGHMTAAAVAALRAALDVRYPARDPAPRATTDQPATRMANARAMLPLLQQSNLRALDLAEEMAVGAADDPALAAVVESTRRLQFGDAGRALLRWIEQHMPGD